MQIHHEDDGKHGRFFIKENDEELAEIDGVRMVPIAHKHSTHRSE